MKQGTNRPTDRQSERATPFCVNRSFAFWRLGAFVLAVVSFFVIEPASPPASAHEPITTKVRFNKEVIRVLQRSCLGCHHPGGIVMSLATYEEARPWAKAIKEELLEKRMPPWHAVKGFADFRNAPLLTQRDVDMIVNWVEGGAPKGDERDLPTTPLFSHEWPLGNPDIALKPERETKITGDADEFRTLVLETNLKEDRMLSAIDLQPGNGAVVHCAKFYAIKPGGGATVKQVNSNSTVSSVDLNKAEILGTWMPGFKQVALEDGTGQLLPGGSRIAVKVHYRGTGEASTDLSTVGLYFAKGSQRRQVQEIPISHPGANIPVAAEPVPVKLLYTVPSDTEAIGIRPRVHPLVLSLQATAYRPDGSEEVLIWTRRYQFDWEPTYYFRHPVSLPKGTRVEVVAYFDNSEENRKNPNDPPKPVRWSEMTNDPICALLVISANALTGPATSR